MSAAALQGAWEQLLHSKPGGFMNWRGEERLNDALFCWREREERGVMSSAKRVSVWRGVAHDGSRCCSRRDSLPVTLNGTWSSTWTLQSSCLCQYLMTTGSSDGVHHHCSVSRHYEDWACVWGSDISLAMKLLISHKQWQAVAYGESERDRDQTQYTPQSVYTRTNTHTHTW